MAIVLGQDSITGVSSIKSNGLEAIQITSDNQILLPYIPCFYAWQPGGAATTSTGTVVFSSTRLNRGGHYNTSNGRFTVPIDGTYEFHGIMLYRAQGTPASSGEITFFLNGGQVNSRGMAYCLMRTNDDHGPTFTSWIQQFNAGDYIQFGVEDVNSSMDWYYGDNLGFFSGKLIG